MDRSIIGQPISHGRWLLLLPKSGSVGSSPLHTEHTKHHKNRFLGNNQLLSSMSSSWDCCSLRCSKTVMGTRDLQTELLRDKKQRRRRKQRNGNGKRSIDDRNSDEDRETSQAGAGYIVCTSAMQAESCETSICSAAYLTWGS